MDSSTTSATNTQVFGSCQFYENLLGIYRSILIYMSRLVEYVSVLIRKVMYFWLNTLYSISVNDDKILTDGRVIYTQGRDHLI